MERRPAVGAGVDLRTGVKFPFAFSASGHGVSASPFNISIGLAGEAEMSAIDFEQMQLSMMISLKGLNFVDN